LTKPDWLGLPLAIAAILAPLSWFLLFLGLGSGADFAQSPAPPFVLLQLILLYPLVEELAFRGFLQTNLRNHVWGRIERGGISVANVCTTLFFVGSHFFYHALLWSIVILLPSLVFGYFRDRYQSVVPCILLHCFYNSGYYLLFGTG
jgi:membrane protease YdiL (CAAX protease family)